MENYANQGIRNLAIIAHVDHGKTTLVDALLKQGQVFRAHQQVGELIMDSDPLERERGITILAKNTAVTYKGVKINVIDTPGHADFSGEVERIMNMADGCLLLVDAVDGPMPQTRYVLQQALTQNVTPMVVINKIDRPEARIAEVVEMVQDLFLELATRDDQLDFPILYASARQGYAVTAPDGDPQDMKPLFDAILDVIPAPSGNEEGPLQMLVATLDFDNYIGQIAIGRVFRGVIRVGDQVALINHDGEIKQHKLVKVFVFSGLERTEVTEAQHGDIVAVTGIDSLSIGDTIAAFENPEALPTIEIDQPTVKMTFGVNTSPFMGKEGDHCTSRMLFARLMRELRINVSLRVETTDSADEFLVSGRGELHLAILVENLRRERFEFQVSRPEPVTKETDGQIYEPYEHLTVNPREEYIGVLSENLAGRLGRLMDMVNDGNGNVRLEYHIPTRGLIGFDFEVLTLTNGEGILSHLFKEYRPDSGDIRTRHTGTLVSIEKGEAMSYALTNVETRGKLFIAPGERVYPGMIVGENPRMEDLPVNPTKTKHVTNHRAAGKDKTEALTPPLRFSLERAIEYVDHDELVEVTPGNVRLRKRILDATERKRSAKRKT